MDKNMVIWEALKKVPKECLKPIKGGRLNGMSSIDPQWRLQAMTHHFGPVGSGWKYEIVSKDTFPGSDGNIIAVVDVNLFYKIGELWSDPIPGTGGSMLVSKEKNGLHTSDEAFKMALTDALSVSMKALGVAADIYLGAFDGSKYADTSDLTRSAIEFITESQAADIQSLISETNTDKEKFLVYFKAKKIEEITTDRHAEAIRLLECKRAKGAA